MQIKEEAEHPHDDNDSGRRDTRVNKHKVGVKRVHAEKWMGLSKEALKMDIYLVSQVDDRCLPLKEFQSKSCWRASFSLWKYCNLSFTQLWSEVLKRQMWISPLAKMVNYRRFWTNWRNAWFFWGCGIRLCQSTKTMGNQWEGNGLSFNNFYYHWLGHN